MRNRCKEEILARNLCYQYRKGMTNAANIVVVPTEHYIDDNWEKWLSTSVKLLDILDKHDSQKDKNSGGKRE